MKQRFCSGFPPSLWATHGSRTLFFILRSLIVIFWDGTDIIAWTRQNFRFTTRLQRLNNIEASSRAKMNYLEQLYRFHQQQGNTRVAVPTINNKPLDVWRLRKEVHALGGFNEVCRLPILLPPLSKTSFAARLTPRFASVMPGEQGEEVGRSGPPARVRRRARPLDADAVVIHPRHPPVRRVLRARARVTRPRLAHDRRARPPTAHAREHADGEQAGHGVGDPGWRHALGVGVGGPAADHAHARAAESRVGSGEPAVEPAH